VQLALTGPLTLAGFIEDEVYGDERALCAALGDALNHEIRDLAAAGCPWIRIDEPRFLTAPEWAVAFGVDNLARCFHRVPKEVTRFVHLPRPAPAGLDEPDPQGSEDTGYRAIAEVLADAPVDAVALADARRANDLSLLEVFTATTVVLGVLDVAASNLETVDAIRDRLRAALDHIDPNRLMAGPDAALDLLPATLARDKLKAMVAAARAL
jgi:5-methyltetrahydropteroyltriglutamate--homocysteine methyltransferase